MERPVNTAEADELGTRVAARVQAGEITKAYTLLAPILAQRTPFRWLDCVGAAVGAGQVPTVNAFLERIADAETEGGWVVIASALGQRFDRDPAGAFEHCRAYIIAADVWYAPDIFGERVPGPALVIDFRRALKLLHPWREDENRWVRRTVGVAVHFWAKRARGAHIAQAKTLLAFLEPLFEEQDLDAVKGVGWGLKTLGKYYPDLMTAWLSKQVAAHRGRYRALMLRKALTDLPAEQRACVTGVDG